MCFDNVYVSLGSNLGDRADNLKTAIARIQESGHRIVCQSPVYETEPQDLQSQPWFLNMVVKIETESSPLPFLHSLQEIENAMGRTRDVARGPRTIDLDILLFGELTMNTEELTVPHPRMWNRRFVLQPLEDIAPGLSVPLAPAGSPGALSELLPRLAGQSIRRID